MTPIRLYTFECGRTIIPLRNHILGAGLAGEMIATPVTWFLLTHPRGNVIIDGGNAAEVAVDARTHWGRILDMSSVEMEPEDAVTVALERMGFDLSEIRWIVQSHLHIDHTGAVADIGSFPNAQVLVSRTEYDFAMAPEGYFAMGYCQADYVKPGVDWVFLEDDEDGYDVFGDGVLRCWRTPGHSPGHLSFEVHLPSGQALMLACDAANTVQHLEERVVSGFMLDAVETRRSIQRLRRLAWRANATVICGHDPDQWPTITRAPEFYD
ncbi:MAG TPA: N-acyl homoserine lactonase family protein [Gaiellaceae bacterium]|jgi:glyoxylase-like metal-dependent hydrolase (beta-lactamase superfamily II)|nr:N-acyl homoserine lactonase family protein [Gaiellaceae bacterium]